VTNAYRFACLPGGPGSRQQAGARAGAACQAGRAGSAVMTTPSCMPWTKLDS